MSVSDPLKQQKEYLLRRAADLTTFAKIQHDRQGRGIVVIGWPAPTHRDVEDLLDSSIYLREDALSLTGLDPIDELVRAVRGYDPTRQAIIMCIETIKGSFNVHVLTATYKHPGQLHSTSH